ncbi:phosphomannomutase [Roseibaca sp. Y0-43]|uniref:phosphomannomutase n=1 Tax=Roseibaca sp. Y0-43 TaxID=2816854 RepID=UPI001D0C974F|nr:phosphomannomutase [Roseibaca sp. Y0-43]MCC1482437.1 phosphomannomutase [Roseibaca sp. Y0-43]
MGPKFGTSGLRGLVADLTPERIEAHVSAFLTVCQTGGKLFVGRDLRPSSGRIAQTVIARALAHGVSVSDCGPVPTPALALAAQSASAGAIMVTGSHIPADRNGLKFYTLQGEITKAEESAISAALGSRATSLARGVLHRHDALAPFMARYCTAFGTQALAGRRLVVWSHSAVGRDILVDILRSLGATVTEVARADHFIPVDTEAVADTDRAFLQEIARLHRCDAILSTDGDSDRPLMTDETGKLVPGDILGQIAAQYLGADTVVTPITSNSGAEQKGCFRSVIRTRIGSPYVIAGMAGAAGRVAGYEANGGFLLGYGAQGPAGPLPALMTRDSYLPMIAALVAAGPKGLAARVAAEPARFTASTRLEQVPTAMSAALVDRLRTASDVQAALVASLGQDTVSDVTTIDGLRLTLGKGRIVHLRASGNAPELRLYTEAETERTANDLLARLHRTIADMLAADSSPALRRATPRTG